MSVINGEYKTIYSSKSIGTSKFTFQDLQELNNPSLSYKLKLSCIGHVDLNAFFAQVEQIRLNLDTNDPVVCVQWSSLIAVSYAARKYGIGRLDTIKTARSKCPNVVLAHAAVFKKGESHWAYVDGLPSQFTHKVLLDPYRRESRKIILIFNQECDLVEKASVDESYLDLGRLVYERLVREFPQLQAPDDAMLPSVPDLEWKLYGETEDGMEVKDWDDVCMCFGSEFIQNIRLEVYKILGYTTSGGVAKNKFLSKLAGGLYKPDNQAIVFNQGIEKFLNRFELDDITGFGGKAGNEILYKLGERKLKANTKAEEDEGGEEGEEVIPEVEETESKNDEENSLSSITRIRNLSLTELKSKLYDDELSEKVYNIVRGERPQELTLKIDVKSMMSRKNFPGKPIVRLIDAFDWIKVFVGDLYNRLIELDDESMNILLLQADKHKPTIRRPKTVSLHFGSLEYHSYSKQSPITVIQDLVKFKTQLEITAFRLIRELADSFPGQKDLNNGVKLSNLKVEEDYHQSMGSVKILGCTSMSLTILNFTKTSNSNLIDTFISKDNRSNKVNEEEFRKYMKSENKAEDDPDTQKSRRKNSPFSISKNDPEDVIRKLQSAEGRNLLPLPPALEGTALPNYCNRCQLKVKSMQEHNDYHMALELSRQINGGVSENPPTTTTMATSHRRPSPSAGKKPTKKRKAEKGQSQLPW